MNLSLYKVADENALTPFIAHVTSESKVKTLCREYMFYNVKFITETRGKGRCIVYLQYPYGNPYWYGDFKRSVTQTLLADPDAPYKKEWTALLNGLKEQVHAEFHEFDRMVNNGIQTENVVMFMRFYGLRDYQAYDFIQLLNKFNRNNKRALILSEPRTGKTRIALALAHMINDDLLNEDGAAMTLVICPKSAVDSWVEEMRKVNELGKTPLFDPQPIRKLSDVRKCPIHANYAHGIPVRVLTYDIFKRLTDTQLRQLTSKMKHVNLICDESHRLRNFKTDQSTAVFKYIESCQKHNIDLGVLGLSGTPSVRVSEDVFGSLCLANASRIMLTPYWSSFDAFREYFYSCEDTTFGKVARALKREDELNFLIRTCAVQTKQRELDMFRNYRKQYKRIDLTMDVKQADIYSKVDKDMEYEDDIDCKNPLVKLMRLQQICVDPSEVVPAYAEISPKLRWVSLFRGLNPTKQIIVCSKRLHPLNHLQRILADGGCASEVLCGGTSATERARICSEFNKGSFSVLLLQLDVGREALTLPRASATIFLDRDWAQGYNEQAEARMTPVDGAPCVKTVYDLVMEGTKEEEIYDILMVRKESINATNTVFAPRKE
ncbi:DEAD/DEAH box helicase [Paratractidigestivibacter sp.]|uniref:DEAD/DEAH box helicase n=1 Tax=Paratractidigestivibacter sp. TaxID=2847316 RepID=UPI002AC91B67|nr:DEAD/DEAH box helicase [Paratractidigestivibacter sp.]